MRMGALRKAERRGDEDTHHSAEATGNDADGVGEVGDLRC